MTEALRLRLGPTMTGTGGGGGAARPSNRGRRRKAAARVAALSLLGLSAAFLLLDGPVPSSFDDSIRKLRGYSPFRRLESCVKTPYLLVRDVVGHMPVVIPPPLRIQPSHVTLCGEYLQRREKYGDAIPEDMEEGPLTVVEDEALCADWSAPHHSLLQIFASSLIARVGSKYGLRYHHRCQRKLPHLNSNDVHFDYTSVQMLLMETLTSDNDKSAVSDEEMVRLCKGCVAEYETNGVPEFSYSASSHQCLLFPGDQQPHSSSLGRSSAVEGGAAVEEESQALAENSQAALATVLSSLTQRLRIVAEDHLPLTDPLEGEGTSGACIFVDDTVTGMSPWVYDRYIPNYVTSIQVFASASCAYAAVHNRHTCIAHGGAVRRYLNANRPGVKIRYDVVASTAASYARLVHCHKVICPPGSVGCMLPALVKVPGTTATVASASLSPNTQRWYEHLAGAQIELDNMEVLELTEEEQYMEDENGVEFVSGAMEREGNVTVDDGNINGTATEVAEGEVTETEGGDLEFVQAVEEPQGATPPSQEQQQEQDKSSGPTVAYNNDGSITLTAGRSNAPPKLQPRTIDGGRGQPQQPTQGQDEGGQPQLVQEAPLEAQQPPQGQDQAGGGPQLVQAAPPEAALPPQQEPDRHQQVKDAAQAQEQEKEEAKTTQTQTPTSESPSDSSGGDEDKSDGEAEPQSGADDGGGGGGGRRLKRLFGSLWGGSSSSAEPATAAAPSRARAPDARGGAIQ